MVFSAKPLAAFSLLEVLFVLAVLVVVGKQSWTQVQLRWFGQTDYEILSLAQQRLGQALRQARQYAVTSQETMSLCGGDYQLGLCSGDWSKGWYLYASASIKSYHLLEHGVDVKWSGFPANKKQIDFYPSGLSGYQNGTFYLCFNHLLARIVLNQSGRFYLVKAQSTSNNGEDCA